MTGTDSGRDPSSRARPPRARVRLDLTGRKRSGWTWFVLWALPGIIVGLQVSAIGIFLLPIGLLASLVLARFTGAGPELLGIVEGLAIACLVVAALNADYWTCPPSGEVITRTRDTVTVESCGEVSPWPWLSVGLVLGIGAVIAYGISRPSRGPRVGSTSPGE